MLGSAQEQARLLIFGSSLTHFFTIGLAQEKACVMFRLISQLKNPFKLGEQ
jgi:hypothetical protein